MFRIGPNLIFLAVIHPFLTCFTQFVFLMTHPSPFLCSTIGRLWRVILLHVWVNCLGGRECDPTWITLLWGHMLKGPELPLSGSIHKNSPHTQVVMEQVAVIDQETQGFLCMGEKSKRRKGLQIRLSNAPLKVSCGFCLYHYLV